MLKLALSGVVAGVEPTPNGGAVRVFIQEGSRRNALLLLPASRAGEATVGQKIGPVEVRVSVERNRDNVPTPNVTYFATAGWPDRKRVEPAAAA